MATCTSRPRCMILLAWSSLHRHHIMRVSECGLACPLLAVTRTSLLKKRKEEKKLTCFVESTNTSQASRVLQQFIRRIPITCTMFSQERSIGLLPVARQREPSNPEPPAPMPPLLFSTLFVRTTHPASPHSRTPISAGSARP